MTTQAQAQQQGDTNANKGSSFSIQPLTDGVISPAIRKIPSPKHHKNNSNNPFLARLSSKPNQYQKLPEKSTNPESPKLSPLMPRKNSEETLPTSKLSKEASRQKNSSRKNSSSTPSRIHLMLRIHPVMNKDRRMKLPMLR